MNKSIWIWEWSQQAEKTPAEVAATLRTYCPSVKTVLVKCMDSDTWMKAYDPLAPGNAQEWAVMRSDFESEGLECIPWVVAQQASDAASHVALCDDAHTELVIDLEPYPGFWQGGDFNAYLDKLIAFGPGADSYHAYVSIDPRPSAWQALNVDSWVSRIWSLMPQLYWPDFGENPWNCVGYWLECERTEKLTYPIYEFSATATDLSDFNEIIGPAPGENKPSLWRFGAATAAQLQAFEVL